MPEWEAERRCHSGGVLEGLELGLLATAFWLGFRHGVDWDHIAAITDIAGTQAAPRRSMALATLYALGHAAVVLVLGVAAILAGDRVPDSLDRAMGRVVGITLLALGVWVFVSLVQQGRHFRMRSRWMLLFEWAQRLRRRAGGPDETDRREGTVLLDTSGDDLAHHPHPHPHNHPLPDRGFADYTSSTALGVGALHGVGAETPTQVLIFLAAAGAGGVGTGLLVLTAFLVGLIVANTIIAATAAYGFLRASRSFRVYAGVAVVTGAFSLVMGALLVLGKDSVLPALLAS